MKRTILFILLFLSVNERLFAFDISGPQPLAPNGIFSTFSAESMQKNKTSIEIAAERSREPDFYRFSVKAAYGLKDNMEFNLTIPYVYRYSDDRDGLEDISVGFKHRFYDEQKYGPSLAYMLNASIPSGADELTS
ncbi:MAG: transporter, partial [Leadbetterella sp.]|nr:transporter [Leadbetterella sp.]